MFKMPKPKNRANLKPFDPMEELLIKSITKLIAIWTQLRRLYHKKLLRVSNINLHLPIYISNPENVFIGEGCAIASFVHIWSNAAIHIGDETIIAAHVQITSSTHDYHQRPYRSKRIDKPVRIGRNVWIGSGAVIMPGVTIGDNSVIGAGSVVTRDIPPDCLAYGVPARVVKKLASNP